MMWGYHGDSNQVQESMGEGGGNKITSGVWVVIKIDLPLSIIIIIWLIISEGSEW